MQAPPREVGMTLRQKLFSGSVFLMTTMQTQLSYIFPHTATKVTKLGSGELDRLPDSPFPPHSTPSQLQDHVDGSSSRNVVRL